jgi:hypothetical protein
MSSFLMSTVISTTASVGYHKPIIVCLRVVINEYNLKHELTFGLNNIHGHGLI